VSRLPETGVIALFGGTFDPPHVAHVLAVAYALASEAIDHVLCVPTFEHAFGKEPGAAFEHRHRMIELAMADLARTSVSRVEAELGGKSLTLRTLEELARRAPAARFRLLVGADVLGEIDKWHRFDRIAEIAPPIVVGRGGYDAPREVVVDLPPISSSEIRNRLASGLPIDGLVPRTVAAYIVENGLYRPEPA
jgi:nicotinate-nucleotide adenylyltransferase